MNLPPDPDEKGLERHIANFGTNWTFVCVSKTKKAKDRTNWEVLGENGPLGATTGPTRPIIAVEGPSRLAGV